MASYHTVKPGEHLASIAAAYGFMSSSTIWEHPGNSELKEKRKNPNVLLSGDQVFIPDKTPRVVQITAGKSSRFLVTREKLKLRLLLEELFSGPVGGAAIEVLVEGKSRTLTADDDGKVELDLPPTAREAVVIIRESGRQQEGVAIPVRIGQLDPVEERSGQIARLNNLGYFAGVAEPPAKPPAPPPAEQPPTTPAAQPPAKQPADQQAEEPNEEPDEDEKAVAEALFRSAVEEFQCDQKLTVDGVCGPKTRAKLLEFHGC